MKINKKQKKSSKGITLIALVITIIVLLILAGVSIAMLTGENGILTQANNAKTQTEIGEEKEAISLAYTGATTEKKGTGTVEASDMEEQFKQNGTDATAEAGIIVQFNKSKRYYKVDSNGTITGPFDTKPQTELTLVEMFEKAQADGCTNEDGQCNNADHLHIGDYVDYKAPTTGSHSVPASKSGVDYEQIYNVADNSLNWRVLGIETDKDTGEKSIKLIADSPAKQSEETGNGNPYFDIKGAEGYLYAPDEMDAIGALFKNDEYAKEARSVNMYDINQALGITTDDQIKEKNFFVMQGAIQYGENYGPFEGQWTPEDWLKSGQPTSTVSGPVTGYGYMIGNESLPPEYSAMTVNVENTRLRSMLFDNVEAQTGKAYWLASRGVDAFLGDAFALFGPGVVDAEVGMAIAGVGSYTFNSDGNENDISGGAAVRPLVVLKSDITKSEISIKEDQPDSWQS